jgi:hypothetical protein
LRLIFKTQNQRNIFDWVAFRVGKGKIFPPQES